MQDDFSVLERMHLNVMNASNRQPVRREDILEMGKGYLPPFLFNKSKENLIPWLSTLLKLLVHPTLFLLNL